MASWKAGVGFMANFVVYHISLTGNESKKKKKKKKAKAVNMVKGN